MSTTSLFRSAALFRAVVLCGALSACGGGGSSSSATAPAGPPGTPPPPALAYLLQTDKVEVCKIDSSEVLVNCVDAGVSGFANMYSMTVAGSHAYIADVGSGGLATIIHCSIGENGTFSDCAPTGPTDLESPNGLGLAVRGSLLYVGVGDGISPGGGGPALTYRCEIKANGSLDACVDAGFPADSRSVNDIRFVDGTAYFAHFYGTYLSKCTVEADGSFSLCDNAGAEGLTGPIQGLVISGKHVYIADAGAVKVLRCVIADDGTVSGCEDAGATGLISPTQVVVRGSTVYITDDESAASLTRCTANSTGLLTGCTSISAERKSLQGMIVR